MTSEKISSITSDEAQYLSSVIPDESATRRLVMLGKRITDIAVSGLLLLMLLPFFALIALGVRLTSRGTVFYSQWRVGLGGKEFRMYKFRSMHTHCCTSQPVMQEGAILKTQIDPRVTSFGRLLRRTSLDELPQLWNVMRGDMSVIGPRPLPQNMLTAATHLLVERASVRPGITGLWQIRDRKNNRSINDMLMHDLEYVRALSVAGDWRIVAKTVMVVITGHGAF